MNRVVTITSDASYCPKTKSSGYGVWVKSDRGVFEMGGTFKTPVKHCQEAHEPSRGPNNFINHICDHLARKAMEEQRGY